MHEVLNSFKQHPSQKFHKNFINFEKPQIFSKIPKVRSKGMKCMIKWGIKDLTSEEEQDQSLRNEFGVIEKSLGGEKAKSNRERSRRNDLKLWGLYI